ncbi:MAG: penicillin-binding protein 2 [bacterium]|nr:penicillin-binding protein 2 [bacterium]
MDYRERWEHKDYLVGRTLDRRIRLFHVGLVLMLLVFVLDFWYLQGVQAERWTTLAENNLRRKVSIRPTRGEIFDRQKQVVASTRPSLDLLLRRESRHALVPQLEKLAPILGVPAVELIALLDEISDRPDFEPLLITGDVDLGVLARIEARRELFPSVEVRESARRHYPAGALVAHAVGYVGEVNERQLAASDGELGRGDVIGKSGVERIYDDRLRGHRGVELVTVNNLGRRIGDARVWEPPAHGEPLELSIDLRLQRTLVDALGDEVGAGVFMDPRTGEVLAIASTPTFDPNMFADGFTHAAWEQITEDHRRPLHDRVIASFYAPGSTFKVVMAVAGLETNTITTTDRVFCNGGASYYGRRRLCWKRGGHGWVDLRKALAGSCNVYFYDLGQKLGIDAIHEYGKIFGLGAPSGIDLAGEERGILPSQEWKQRTQREVWYPGDTISVAIGQGFLAVTPAQLARLISAVATSGDLPRPHLRRGVSENPTRLDISPETWRVVRDALALAVSSGTGREATLGAFSVAGKTGTAQVYRHSAGVDSEDLPKHERDHGWFVGYAPVERPEVAFAVVVEHGGHGGSAAAPVARKVLEAFFESGLGQGQLRVGRGRMESSSARSPAAR